MPVQEIDVENFHELPGIKPADVQLHTVKYKNFKVDCGRFEGQRVIMHIYGIRGYHPEMLQAYLMRHFENRLYPPEVHWEPDVLTGNKRTLSSGKRVEQTAEGSHTILWRYDLPEDIIKWVKRKVRELDEQLTKGISL